MKVYRDSLLNMKQSWWSLLLGRGTTQVIPAKNHKVTTRTELRMSEHLVPGRRWGVILGQLWIMADFNRAGCGMVYVQIFFRDLCESSTICASQSSKKNTSKWFQKYFLVACHDLHHVILSDLQASYECMLSEQQMSCSAAPRRWEDVLLASKCSGCFYGINTVS